VARAAVSECESPLHLMACTFEFTRQQVSEALTRSWFPGDHPASRKCCARPSCLNPRVRRHLPLCANARAARALPRCHGFNDGILFSQLRDFGRQHRKIADSRQRQTQCHCPRCQGDARMRSKPRLYLRLQFRSSRGQGAGIRTGAERPALTPAVSSPR